MIQDMTHRMNKDIAQGLAMRARLMLTGLMLLLMGGNAIAQVTVNGNVYGGGNEADVQVNTEVNITSSTATVAGSVFGGGKGKADNFECSKAMVGVKDEGVTVTVEEGKEIYTLLPGGTKVTITDGTVEGNVYGGGKMGHVGYFTLDDDDSNDIPNGKPISLVGTTGTTGTCYVTISNGDIGPNDMSMWHLPIRKSRKCQKSGFISAFVSCVLRRRKSRLQDCCSKTESEDAIVEVA